jgi:hypothetical protein
MNTLSAFPDNSLRAVLVAHTHWDREWYLTVEQTRPRLARLFAHLRQILTEEPAYHSFWLDGQVAPLHDFWDGEGARPAWLEHALHEQRILIGPWYTLVDEWLVTGEAMVRNLDEGRRAMADYGQRNSIGYLPDAFGHVSQMPAILNGFGIDNAFLFRGLGEDQLPCVEFMWAAPGGAGVRGTHLLGGYDNAQRIDAERHLRQSQGERVLTSVRQLTQRSATRVLLLMNGVDLSLPTHHLDCSISLLEELLPGVAVRHASLADYLSQSARPAKTGRTTLPTISGELLFAPGLDGTLSARVEQKIANRSVENLLTSYVEPLLALLDPCRRSHYAGLLRRAWRLVMQCQAHDSICSCHSDLVAADVMARLAQARQLAEGLERETLCDLLGVRPAEDAAGLPSTLVLRNPLPWDWSGPVEVTADLPPGTDPERLTFSQDGQTISAQVVSQEEICRWTEHYFGKVADKTFGTVRSRILLRPTIGAGAFASVGVHADTNGPSSTEAAVSAVDVLDNGIVRVTVYGDGRLDLLDLETGQALRGLNQVVDEPDAGDLYEHARRTGSEPSCPRPVLQRRVEDGILRQTIEVEAEIACNGVSCRLRVRVSLCAGSRLVLVQTTLDNRSRDHWLRAVCPLDGGVREIRAHTPYDFVPRGVADGSPFQDGARVRFAARLGQPMQWGVFARTKHGLLACLNRGLYEYTCEDEETLALSLMRFVGLIRADLADYSAAGGNRPGPMSVEYAFGFWPRGEFGEAGRAMFEYNLPPRVFQVFGEPPTLPPAGFRLSNPLWLPSAWKPAESGDGAVVRFWSASHREETGTVEYAGGLDGAYRARLDETPVGVLQSPLVTSPHEIVTLVVPLRSGT